MLERLKTMATVVALAVAYYWLTFFVFQSTLAALPPSWWGGAFLTSHARVLTWFGMQDVVCALASAVPIALVFYWLIDRFPLRLALAVAAPTAVLAVLEAYSEYDGVHWKMYLWIYAVVLFLTLLFAVPLLVFLASKVQAWAAMRPVASTA